MSKFTLGLRQFGLALKGIVLYIGWLPFALVAGVGVLLVRSSRRGKQRVVKSVAKQKEKEIKREDDSDLHSRITDFE